MASNPTAPGPPLPFCQSGGVIPLRLQCPSCDTWVLGSHSWCLAGAAVNHPQVSSCPWVFTAEGSQVEQAWFTLLNLSWLLPVAVCSLTCPDMGSLILTGTEGRLTGLWFPRLAFPYFWRQEGHLPFSSCWGPSLNPTNFLSWWIMVAQRHHPAPSTPWGVAQQVPGTCVAPVLWSNSLFDHRPWLLATVLLESCHQAQEPGSPCWWRQRRQWRPQLYLSLLLLYCL